MLVAAAWLRPPEYDEAYSIFLTAGHARPVWPDGVFTAGSVRWLYRGTAGFGRIAHDLRVGDVHPPLYFWALEIWRRVAGPSWFAARLLSVAFSVAGLALLARLAARAAVPVVPALLVAGLSYGFAYTGSVARGFALAQGLNILGALLVLSRPRRAGFAGGLAFGAASFANYLASFTGAAFILWLLLRRAFGRAAAAAAGFALFLPADLWFFLAQRGTRTGQFTPFHLASALARLARDGGATLFGGLPVYAGPAGGIVTVLLAVLALACAGFAIRHRNASATPFLFAAAATPAGLLALGLVFDNTPIEIRYLAFAVPWLALLLAVLPPAPLAVLLAAEACGVTGLCLAPATMQPQGLAAYAAARSAPGDIVLVPYGNDGVGVPGPFVAAAPDVMKISLIRPDILPHLDLRQPLAAAEIRADGASRATIAALNAMLDKEPCLGGNTFGIITIYPGTCAPLRPTYPRTGP